MGDAWEDKVYAGEDDWGAESVETDLEEDELDVDLETGALEAEDEDDDLGGDFDDAA